jgi:hypothetical protein
MIEDYLIIFLRGVSTILFSYAALKSWKLHNYAQQRTKIWFLVTITMILASLESLTNFFQWAEFYPKISDTIGEFILILFLLQWCWIAYRFLTIQGVKK